MSLKLTEKVTKILESIRKVFYLVPTRKQCIFGNTKIQPSLRAQRS